MIVMHDTLLCSHRLHLINWTLTPVSPESNNNYHLRQWELIRSSTVSKYQFKTQFERQSVSKESFKWICLCYMSIIFWPRKQNLNHDHLQIGGILVVLMSQYCYYVRSNKIWMLMKWWPCSHTKYLFNLIRSTLVCGYLNVKILESSDKVGQVWAG